MIDDVLTSIGNDLLSIELGRVGVNLILTMLLAQILAWHYLRFAQVLSNKRKFARNFVVISSTTLLVISIVGSSLALSLGLVGALSIVRFRTPIKEPEELAYLFLAIGVGIGMGASETGVTLLVFAALLAFMTARHYTGSSERPLRTVLQVTAPAASDHAAGQAAELDQLRTAVEGACDKVDIRRVDYVGSDFNASLLVELGTSNDVSSLLAEVRKTFPTGEVSLVETDSLD